MRTFKMIVWDSEFQCLTSIIYYKQNKKLNKNMGVMGGYFTIILT